MTLKELKNKLINEINQSQDVELLKEMYRLISNQETDDDLFILSDEQIKAVEEAQLQILNGQLLTNEQADKEIEEWFEKQP
jgi:hypothetical protein